MVNKVEYHCNDCILPKEQQQGEMKGRVVLFLQIDDVLECNHNDPVMLELIEQAAHSLWIDKDSKAKEEDEGIAPLTTRIAQSAFLEENAVAKLMELIKKVNAAQMAASIVLIGSWCKDGTTEEVCTKMFKDQPFGEYIVGCASSNMVREKIKTWVSAHEIQHYLLIMERLRAIGDGCTAVFKERLVSVVNGFDTAEVQDACKKLGLAYL